MANFPTLSQVLGRKDYIWDLSKSYYKQNPSFLNLEFFFNEELSKLELKLINGLITQAEYKRYLLDLCLGCCLCSVFIGLESVPKSSSKQISIFSKVMDQLNYYTLGNNTMSAQQMTDPFHRWFCYGKDLHHRKLGYKNSKLLVNNCCKGCQSCKDYADLGWQPLGVIPIPGFRCKSKEKCRCGLQYK